jgi:hypothetical protein
LRKLFETVIARGLREGLVGGDALQSPAWSRTACAGRLPSIAPCPRRGFTPTPEMPEIAEALALQKASRAALIYDLTVRTV